MSITQSSGSQTPVDRVENEALEQKIFQGDPHQGMGESSRLNGQYNGNGFHFKKPTKQNNPPLFKKSITGQPTDRSPELPQSEAGKRVSLEEYLRSYADHPIFNYEWNNGILEEKPVSTISQLRLYRWFLQILSYYLEVYQLAEAGMFEFQTEMQVGDKLIKRKPDLFIVRNDNPNPLHSEDESYTGVCDLCVELISTSNQANIDRDVKTKKKEYAAAGVREYLILDVDGDYMKFYRLTEKGTYKVVKPNLQGIVTFETLPGFQFRWSDIQRRPPLRQLIEDPIYNHYILPEYEMLKQRVEREAQRALQETQRAEQEAQRAAQEAQRAEQAEDEAQKAKKLAAWYASQLRALGVEPSAFP